MADEQSQNIEENKIVTFSDFLESVPPGQFITVSPVAYYYQHGPYFKLPEITLHCDSEFCNGERFFKSEESEMSLVKGNYKYHFITYKCKNCQQTPKIYSIAINLSTEKNEAVALKFGEFPPFGPPTPSKLIELIGPDKDIYLMGRRCENQGLGIGALVYYRRVVENQKNRILDKIIQVAQKISADGELIKELETAKTEVQFSRAIESLKQALPESLRIDNHNPLTLLHGALSEGVHDKSDQECLDIAQSIRIILSELASRLAQSLKDEAEIKSAISKLIKRKKEEK